MLQYKKNEAYDPNYIQNINQYPKNISQVLTENIVKKNSPNQVEAMPDDQVIYANEELSII